MSSLVLIEGQTSSGRHSAKSGAGGSPTQLAWLVAAILAAAAVWPVECFAGRLIGDFVVEGATREEAEDAGVRPAVRKALKDHFGLSPSNPVTELILKSDVQDLKRQFLERYAGLVRPDGNRFVGRLTYYTLGDEAHGYVQRQIRRIISENRFDNIVFGITATADSRTVSLAAQRKMSADIGLELSRALQEYGMINSTLPENVRRRIEAISSSTKAEAISTQWAEHGDSLMNEAVLSEDGIVSGVGLGLFRIYQEQPREGGMLVNWELRGNFVDIRQGKERRSTHAFAPVGVSFGTSWEDAVQSAYKDAARAAVFDGVMEAIGSAAKVGGKPVRVRLCGIDDLDAQLALRKALVRGGAERVDVTQAGQEMVVAVGRLTSVVETYEAIGPTVKEFGWKARQKDDAVLLVGNLHECP